MVDRLSNRAPVDWSHNRKYAVIIDAGSSGSRVQVYSWRDHTVAARQANELELASLPRIEKGDEEGEHWMKKIHPGISTFADNPEDVGHDHLKKLYKHAMKVVPEAQVKETPVYLLATAGMRLLEERQQKKILKEACQYTKKHTEFLVPECDTHFQVITGEMEGLYGWISINYLLGGFDAKIDGKHHTYGFLDMGGASAQIAFVPNKTEAARHKEDLTLLRLRTLGGETKEWQVFVSTWLGFGANEARRRHIQRLMEDKKTTSTVQYHDPCMPKGLVEDLQNNDPATPSASLLGTGNLKECLTALEPLLSKDAPCLDDPCLFAGVHVPSIDFDINHFIGISEYYYSAQDVFGLGGAYDYHTLSSAVEQYCTRDWSDILTDLQENKFPEGVKQGKLEDVCFKVSWMMNVLHSGIGIPRVTKEFSISSPSHNGTEELEEGARAKGFDGAFNSAETLAGTEVSWTLGKMLLYSSSSVSTSSAEPVGFGPNSQDYRTFQVAGELGDYPVNVSLGEKFAQHLNVTFVFILFFLGLFLMLLKGFRLSGCLASMSHLWHKNQRKIIGARGDQSYERVMEEGDADENRQFEMNALSRKELQRSTVFSNGLSRTSSQLCLNRGSRESSVSANQKTY